MTDEPTKSLKGRLRGEVEQAVGKAFTAVLGEALKGEDDVAGRLSRGAIAATSTAMQSDVTLPPESPQRCRCSEWRNAYRSAKSG